MLVEVKVPVLPESVAEASILAWHKKAGEVVRQGEKLVDIETDKVVLEVPAPDSGLLMDIFKAEGSTVGSEEEIAQIHTDVDVESLATEIAEDQAALALVEEAAPAPPPKTGPAVRKLAAEQGIELTRVPHQGERVTKADMLSYLDERQRPRPAAEVTETSVAAADEGRPERRVPMTRLRRRAAERLLQAQHQHAILTTFNEINMQGVVDLRARYKDEFEKSHGIKLGFMSFFVKAAVAALQKFPIVNASSEGDDIVYHGYYDIGIAVSSPRGLVVPVLRDADRLSFAEVEKGIAEFGKRARDASLGLEDLEGGTFTITNGGIFGSMLSTPILNPPQSAILGMHNIVERPVAENGQVVVRPVMYVALSYDHRLIDGRDAVQFLVAIKRAVEDPARLLLTL